MQYQSAQNEQILENHTGENSLIQMQATNSVQVDVNVLTTTNSFAVLADNEENEGVEQRTAVVELLSPSSQVAGGNNSVPKNQSKVTVQRVSASLPSQIPRLQLNNKGSEKMGDKTGPRLTGYKACSKVSGQQYSPRSDADKNVPVAYITTAPSNSREMNPMTMLGTNKGGEIPPQKPAVVTQQKVPKNGEAPTKLIGSHNIHTASQQGQTSSENNQGRSNNIGAMTSTEISRNESENKCSSCVKC